MNQQVAITKESNRLRLIKRGRYLEYFTIGYNSLEGLIAIAAGLVSRSIVLVGFGFNSLIEVASGTVRLWRFHADVDEARRQRVETISLRLVAICFVALALYVGDDSFTSLLRHQAADESLVGIVLAAISLVVMPLLVRAKRRVARAINSGALMADSKQTEVCTYLSAILLGGLLLNALFGWWWADPIAALIMVGIIVKEGSEGFAR